MCVMEEERERESSDKQGDGRFAGLPAARAGPPGLRPDGGYAS